ncbi:MAG: D-lactate dehydrogenase [Patescibacteria group bacterium]|jgi:D-lactate dehydrogenase|nr:D-lactate dehydrogenase [Patescibacteria group bacterium]
MKVVLFDLEQNEIETYKQLLTNSSDVSCHTEPLNEDSLSMASDAEVISVFVTSRITSDMFSKLTNLKYIVCRSTGYDNVDTKAAKEKDIVVCNVPNYGEHTVAEYAFTLLLSLTRKLQDSISQVQQGKIDHTKLVGTDLAGSTLGVIGAGRIGQRMITIANGFEMKVIAYDPFAKPEVAKKLGFEYVELDELFARADIVTLHVPGGKNNDAIINESTLEKFKDGALLINTARGDLVDNVALIEALENGKLAGAGLDVLDGESMIDIDHEMALLKKSTAKELKLSAELAILEKMPNVILSPHNAYNTHQALQRIRKSTAETIIGFEDAKIQNQVN